MNEISLTIIIFSGLWMAFICGYFKGRNDEAKANNQLKKFNDDSEIILKKIKEEGK